MAVKLDISVKDTSVPSSCADVDIEWFGTYREKWDLKWEKSGAYHKVQFPVPYKTDVSYDARMQTQLEKLLKEVRINGLKSVALAVYRLGSWDIKSLVPILLKAACATNSDAKIILYTSSELRLQEIKVYLQSPEYKKLSDGSDSADRPILPVNEVTYEKLLFFESDSFKKVTDKGCVVMFDSGNVEIVGAKARECRNIIKTAIDSVNKLLVDSIITSSFDHQSLRREVERIKQKKRVYCTFRGKDSLAIYGTTLYSIQDAKQEIERSAKPRSKPLNDRAPVNSNVSHGKGHTARSDGNQTPSDRNVKSFRTKENIEIQVYVGDILLLNVDCIVNAANSSLRHEGGIAEAIAKAAGKDFRKECEDFIKKNKQLSVGEACRTTAGKLQCRCVVHSVGPCWKLYAPHSQDSVNRCKSDLKTAVLNSLKAVTYDRRIRSIAFPAISSGKLGVPRELCCVQYAEALIEYSRDTAFPLKEIHFVHTDPGMIHMITETFDSMINKGRPPRSYNEKVYITQSSSGYSGHGATVGSCSTGNPGNHSMSYPSYAYTTLPGHGAREFTCSLGPYQKVYIYTGNILKIPKIDLIACGDVPKGNKTGSLAQALWNKCDERYRISKLEAFKDKSEGDVVFCKTQTYRFIAHVLLIQKKKFKTENERQSEVNSIFHAIYDGMKTHGCRTMAIPLIGTGKGSGDPLFYAERFIESLMEFCSFQKSFVCDIHLVNFDQNKTDTAIRVVKAEIGKQMKQGRQPHKKPDNRYQTTANSDHSWNKHTSSHNRDNGYDPQTHHKTMRPAGIPQTSKQWSNGDQSHTVSKNSKSQFSQSCRNQQQKPNYAHSSSEEELSALVEKPGKRIDFSKSERIPSTSKQSSTTFPPNSPVLAREKDSSKDTYTTVKDSDVDLPKGNLLIVYDDKEVTKREDLRRKSESNSQGAVGTDSDDDRSDNDDIIDDSDDYDYNGDDHYDDDHNGSQKGTSDDEDMEVDNFDEDNKKSVDYIPENCVICMDTILESKLKTLPCGHKFCADCIDQQFVYKEACPTCGFVCGVITGDQPDGDMDINVNRSKSCDGYEDYDRIEITYTFISGRQGSNHPEPGKYYKGIKRTAFLPNNKQGKKILEMLKIAFDRKLIFTIGRSRTTGADSVITWNDIHHKTDPKPNSQFGYPDPTYLDRVTDELKAKGVTEDDIPTLPGRPRRR